MRSSVQPWRPTRSRPWDRAAAAHLLRRAGFGAGPAELELALESGLDGSLERLHGPSGHDPRLLEGVRAVLSIGSIEGLQAWWMALILGGGDPLGERLTLFWHDHFATSYDKLADVRLMQRQNQLLRELGRGDFRVLLHAVARDPAMLVWLDGDLNRKGHPNENFAREVLELFALGIGNYGEQDVLEAARAFTGWGTRGRAFAERREQHDEGLKHVLGRSGSFDGDALLDVILDQPACPRHVARRLIEGFVAAPVEQADVQALADVLVAGAWNIEAALDVLLRSELFWSPAARHARIAGPVELVAGTQRALAAQVAPVEAVRAAARMGQSLLRPPSVKGWDGGRAWINAGTWIARHDALTGLVLAGGRVDLDALLGPARERAALPERACQALLLRDPGEPFRAALAQAAHGADDDDQARARVVALVLTSPEYQLV